MEDNKDNQNNSEPKIVTERVKPGSELRLPEDLFKDFDYMHDWRMDPKVSWAIIAILIFIPIMAVLIMKSNGYF